SRRRVGFRGERIHAEGKMRAMLFDDADRQYHQSPARLGNTGNFREGYLGKFKHIHLKASGVMEYWSGGTMGRNPLLQYSGTPTPSTCPFRETSCSSFPAPHCLASAS